MEESFLESFGRLSLRQQQQPPRPPAPPPPRGTPPRRHSFRKHLYLLRGLPGSGKTTLARDNWCEHFPGSLKIVPLDSLHHKIVGDFGQSPAFNSFYFPLHVNTEKELDDLLKIFLALNF
ncbi:NEDD4-binding protein 2-like 1 isoform X5 [Lagenorhynchus albirostris]|uniref:NEDD4-binding protein 2-like 1 isoform X5 n=1 Tax=Lagenorhynchus albirostris TaxID=27610 RepID=UPI0028E7010D|nr:NEDD4-binding protein 2-like 1 isoform X5 [Lagenorhynchus albirostris]